MAKENKKKQMEQELEETGKETVPDTESAKADCEDNQDTQDTGLEKQIDSLTKENEELKNQALRQRAEFENFKKRTQREKDDLYNYAKSDCVEALLGVIDNFERALETECADETFKQGVEMIFHQMDETLKKLGVEEIPALGESFDPELHNAVNQVENDEFGDNTVCQVFQKGYKLGDKVIRHSMVVVANP